MNRRVLHAAAWLLPPLLTLIAYRSSPGFDLVGDAVFLIQDNAWMRSWGDLWNQITHDYFWASSGEVIGYWRPVTKASWLVEQLLWGADPAAHHVVQVGWLLLAVVGVQALGRELSLTPLEAMFAALIVGLHPALVEPVCLVMARSDVVSMAAMVWAVLFWRVGWRTGRARWLVPQLIALIIALGSKEVAVVTPAIFGLFWMADRGWTRGGAAGALTLGPAVILVALYLVLRSFVIGESGGMHLALDPLRWFATGGRYLVGLLPFRLETGVRNLPITEARSALSIISGAAAWVGFLGLSVWVSLRRRVGLAFAGWMALVMAPVLLVEAINVPNVDGKYPMADRWLAHAVPGAALLLVHAAGRLRGPWPGRLLGGALGIWAVATLIVSGTTHQWYSDARSLLECDEAHYLAIPAEHRTPQDECNHFERELLLAIWDAGDDDIAGLSDRLRVYRSELRCTPGEEILFNLASYHIRRHRHASARPLLEQLLGRGDLGRSAAMAQLLMGVVEVRDGDPELGLGHLEAARRLGLQDCRIPMEEAIGLYVLDRKASSAASFEAAYRCLLDRRRTQDPNLLFAAALGYVEAGDREAAARLMPELEAMEPKMGATLRSVLDELRGSLGGGVSP